MAKKDIKGHFNGFFFKKGPFLGFFFCFFTIILQRRGLPVLWNAGICNWIICSRCKFVEYHPFFIFYTPYFFKKYKNVFLKKRTFIRIFKTFTIEIIKVLSKQGRM